MIVEKVRTPIPIDDLPDIIAGGYIAAFGEDCPDYCLRMAWAQLVLEHGRENKHPDGDLDAVWCFNLGNQDATRAELADESLAVFQTVPEDEGHGTSKWKARHTRRAYDTAEDGAEAYWRRLASHYEEGLRGMRANSIPEFVDGLRRARYFTASPAAYQKTITDLVSEARRRGV